MHIDELNLKNFRNYSKLAISFSPGVNFIMGDNGVGKSNILEAISILSNVKSFRNITDAEIIQWGQTSYYATAFVNDGEMKKYEVGCIIDNEQEKKIRKRVKIDGNEAGRVSDYYGKLLTVIFSPMDINIINGAPEVRRKFFDSVLSKIDISYMETLNEFKKVLVSRNRILKLIRERKINDTRQLDPWDTLFAEKASVIISKRKSYVDRFAAAFQTSYGHIAEHEETPEIFYDQNSETSETAHIHRILFEKRVRDIMAGSTGMGPQRDDFILRNRTGSHFVNYASQGQKRTAAIAMKIAECEIIEEKSKRKSVILVDDIFSELDEKRRRNMVEVLSRGNQVIFTMVNSNSVNMSDFPGSRHFMVNTGGTMQEMNL
ncbi:MAG: hypothetical protein CVV44_08940 [Spirochaetae bacterium HGW-Spirochaetae-1]|jgi:DNA replication and repair protein RecF|nr:MAG: hypothetical protein CVV44_08940 [Spirochaetae bacterium HGW-Spirochaetae-1]